MILQNKGKPNKQTHKKKIKQRKIKKMLTKNKTNSSPLSKLGTTNFTSLYQPEVTIIFQSEVHSLQTGHEIGSQD